MTAPQDPRRSVTPPSYSEPPRYPAPSQYSGTPYISPFEARAPRPDGAADLADLWDVVGALVIDVALVVGAITLLAAKQDPALYLVGWLVVRYLPLVVAATTPGGLIAGIRVRGPKFAWANPLRILIREVTMPLAAVGLLIDTNPHWLGTRNEWDNESASLVGDRLLPDLIAGTWTVEARS